MKIRCKKSKRFLCDIDIESYLIHLNDIGVIQEIPLKLKIPCKACKKVEIYNIYNSHYKFEKNEDDA